MIAGTVSCACRANAVGLYLLLEIGRTQRADGCGSIRALFVLRSSDRICQNEGVTQTVDLLPHPAHHIANHR
jgi:hypothetical protein